MSPPVIGIALGILLVAIAHEWLGERYLLPRLFALPAFQEIFTPVPRVRAGWRTAWLIGTMGILGFAALILDVEATGRLRGRMLVMLPMIMLTSSSLVIGTFGAFILKPKVQHLGPWASVVLWASLVAVVVMAWYFAQTTSAR